MAKYRITSIPQSLPKAQRGLFKKRKKEKDPIVGRSISNTYTPGDMPIVPESNVYFPQYTIENPGAPASDAINFTGTAPLRYDALKNYFTDEPLIEPTYNTREAPYVTKNFTGYKKVPIDNSRFDRFDIQTGRIIPGNFFGPAERGPFELPISDFIPTYELEKGKLHYYDPEDPSVEAIASRMNQPTSEQEYTSYPEPIALRSQATIDREKTWNDYVAKQKEERGKQIVNALIKLQEDRIKTYVTDAHGPIKNNFNPKHIEIPPYMQLTKEEYNDTSKEELDLYQKQLGLIPYFDKKDNTYKFYETKLIAGKIWNQGLRSDELINKSKIGDTKWIKDNFGELIKEADNQYRNSFYEKWLKERVEKDLDPTKAAESYGIKWGVPSGIKKFSGESEKKLVKHSQEIYNNIANNIYSSLGLTGMDNFTLNGTTLFKGDPVDLIPRGVKDGKAFYMNNYIFKDFNEDPLHPIKSPLKRNQREMQANAAKQKVLDASRKIPKYKMVKRGDGRMMQELDGYTYDPFTLQNANDAYDKVYNKEYYELLAKSVEYRTNKAILKNVQDRLLPYQNNPSKVDELINMDKAGTLIDLEAIKKITAEIPNQLIKDVNAKQGIYPEGTATIGPAPAYTQQREELTMLDKIGDYLHHPIDALTYALDPTVSMHPDGRKFTYDELMDIGEQTGDYSWQGDPGGALGSFTRGVGNFFIQPFNPVKMGTDWAKAYNKEGLLGLGESMVHSGLSMAGARGGVNALKLLDKSADAIKAYRVAAGLNPQWISSGASYLKPMVIESMKPLIPYIAAYTPFAAIRTGENLGLQYNPDAEGLSKFIDTSKINPLAAAWYGLNTYWGSNILKNVYKTPGYNLAFGENLPFSAKLQTPKGGAFTFGTQTPLTELSELRSAISPEEAQSYFKQSPLKKEFRQFSTEFHPDKLGEGVSEAEKKTTEEIFKKGLGIYEGQYYKTLPFYNTGDGYRLAVEANPQFSKPLGPFGTFNIGRPGYRPATIKEIVTGEFQNLTPEVKSSGVTLDAKPVGESEILKPKRSKPSGKKINRYGGDIPKAQNGIGVLKNAGNNLVKAAGNVVKYVAPSLAKYIDPAEKLTVGPVRTVMPAAFNTGISASQIPPVPATIPSQIVSGGNYSMEDLSPKTTSNPDIVNKYMQMTIDFPEEEMTPERVALLERALSFTPIETLPNTSSQGTQLEFNFPESSTAPVTETGLTQSYPSEKNLYMNNLDWLRLTGKKWDGRGRYNMAGEETNFSGLSKNDLINMGYEGDIEELFGMSNEDFQNTVFSPSGKLMPYMTADLRIHTLINFDNDQRKAFATEFNKDIAILNEIAKRRNKPGNPVYEFQPLNWETGTLPIRTPPQTITYDNGQTVIYPGGETSWNVGINAGKYKGPVEDIASKSYIEDLPGLSMRNTAMGVYPLNVRERFPFPSQIDDAPAITGTGAYEALNEYLKLKLLGNVKSSWGFQTPSGIANWNRKIRSGKAFGFQIGDNLFGALYKEGGVSLKLSKKEIDKYVKGGYIVEEE